MKRRNLVFILSVTNPKPQEKTKAPISFEQFSWNGTNFFPLLFETCIRICLFPEVSPCLIFTSCDWILIQIGQKKKKGGSLNFLLNLPLSLLMRVFWAKPPLSRTWTGKRKKVRQIHLLHLHSVLCANVLRAATLQDHCEGTILTSS